MFVGHGVSPSVYWEDWEDWEEEPLLLVAVLGWRTLVAGTQTSHSPVQSRSLTIYLAEAPQQLQQPFFSLQAR